MERKFSTAVIIPLVGMVAVLAMAYGSQVLEKTLQTLNAKYFDLNLIFWFLISSAIATIIVTMGMLGLFWVMMNHSPKWIGWIYLIAGFFIFVYPIGWFYLAQRVHTLPYVPILSPLLEYLVPGSLLYVAAGGIGTIGLIQLVISRRRASAGG